MSMTESPEWDLLCMVALPFGNLEYGCDYHGRQFIFKFLHLSRLHQYNLIVFYSQAFPHPWQKSISRLSEVKTEHICQMEEDLFLVNEYFISRPYIVLNVYLSLLIMYRNCFIYSKGRICMANLSEQFNMSIFIWLSEERRNVYIKKTILKFHYARGLYLAL